MNCHSNSISIISRCMNPWSIKRLSHFPLGKEIEAERSHHFSFRHIYVRRTWRAITCRYSQFLYSPKLITLAFREIESLLSPQFLSMGSRSSSWIYKIKYTHEMGTQWKRNKIETIQCPPFSLSLFRYVLSSTDFFSPVFVIFKTSFELVIK